MNILFSSYHLKPVLSIKIWRGREGIAPITFRKKCLSKISNHQLLLAHVFKNKGITILDQRNFIADHKKNTTVYCKERFSFAWQVSILSLQMISQSWKSRKKKSESNNLFHRIKYTVGQSVTPFTQRAVTIHNRCKSI